MPYDLFEVLVERGAGSNSVACPHCGADMRGSEIPEAWREAFGGSTHFLRVIGIYDSELDRTVAVRCPDCGKEDAR